MYDGKLRMAPHVKTTRGGTAFWSWVLFVVGTQAWNRVSTAFRTLLSCLSLASKNISSDSFEGSLPRNSGGGALPEFRADFVSHFAVFVSVSSRGLNWNSI